MVLGKQVGPTGVEPARPFGHMPLKHARLPIPPRAQPPTALCWQSIESTQASVFVNPQLAVFRIGESTELGRI